MGSGLARFRAVQRNAASYLLFPATFVRRPNVSVIAGRRHAEGGQEMSERGLAEVAVRHGNAKKIDRTRNRSVTGGRIHTATDHYSTSTVYYPHPLPRPPPQPILVVKIRVLVRYISNFCKITMSK